jgi:hypothetical protein
VRTISAHVLGQVQAFRARAVRALIAFDAAGNAAGARVVRHQHQVTAGQADEGGQRGALVATLFLLDLDDDFLAFLEHVRMLTRPPASFGDEVFAGDFLQGQEAVTVGTELDESGFEAGLDAGDAALCAGFFLFAGGVFEMLAFFCSREDGGQETAAVRDTGSGLPVQ